VFAVAQPAVAKLQHDHKYSVW